MKRFAAQYIMTGNGEVIRQGTVVVDNDHTIVEVIPADGGFKERASTRFFNGVIVPGFINSHCHIELSAMKGLVDKGTGLPGFVREIREKRSVPGNISEKISKADRDMWESGTQACVDICNTSDSFDTKANSPVYYVNLLEVFGIDPSAADKRIGEILMVKKEAERHGLVNFLTPHSLYSPSIPLLQKLVDLSLNNKVTSVHFKESLSEEEFLESGKGEMLKSYLAMGIRESDVQQRVTNHISGILKHVTSSGNLILVHNTFITQKDIVDLKARKGVFYCLCPGSNSYIEERMPPVEMLINHSADIVIGTDSLASNNSLSMLDEMYTLQQAAPGLSLREMIPWATLNGSRAINMTGSLGMIKPGMKPGLILITDIDLKNLRLTEKSRSVRLG